MNSVQCSLFTKYYAINLLSGTGTSGSGTVNCVDQCTSQAVRMEIMTFSKE